jgi:hypothetical protein
MLNKKLFQLLYLLSCLLRIFAIFILLASPVLGWIILTFIDTVDYALALRAGLTWPKYQAIDKALDALNRVYFVLVFYLLAPNIIFYTSLAFLLIRGLGDILYFLKHQEKYYFFFPNVLEYFFIVYFLTYDIYLSLIISVPIKVAHEYFVHIKRWIDPISLKYLKNHPEHKRAIS